MEKEDERNPIQNPFKKFTKEKYQSKDCLFCHQEETANHLLLECKNFRKERKEALEKISKILEEDLKPPGQIKLNCWFQKIGRKKKITTGKIEWRSKEEPLEVQEIFIQQPQLNITKTTLLQINKIILETWYGIWLERNNTFHKEFEKRKTAAETERKRKEMLEIERSSTRRKRQRLFTAEGDKIPPNNLRSPFNRSATTTTKRSKTVMMRHILGGIKRKKKKKKKKIKRMHW
eukprot:TRINITY_DN3634_c0_g1_i1.p1 TRINITY_DN3634_c0_g1~~TRINITY_DN3634_c0_g1_i1.p1  ORF type:complete len:273 (+),score=88.41 TRINITY_DN3634_c0_g1_i1:123-821(+)